MSTPSQTLCPLLVAVKARNFETADSLLSSGTSCKSLIEYRSLDKNGTLLHEAILKEDSETLRYLITIPELLASLYAIQDADGCTPKFLAATLGKITLLKSIFKISEKQFLEYRNEITKEPLWVYSARIGSLTGIEALLSLSALKNQLIQSQCLLRSTLVAAIKSKNFKIFQLISETCKIFDTESAETRNFIADYRCPETGGSILTVAVKHHRIDCLEYLLQMKEVVLLLESADAQGMTPLVAAVEQGSKEMTAFLVQKGAKTIKLRTYLYSDKFDFLYDGREHYRPSLLDKAIQENKPNTVSLIFSFMTQQEIMFLMNLEAVSPIMKAVMANKIDMLKFLINQHPDSKTLTEIQDSLGRNLLMIAAMHSSPEVVNCLLQIPTFKAVINLRNRTLESPLSLACKKSKFDVAKILLQQGASLQEFLEYRFGDDSTVLIEALWRNNFDAVQFILSLKGSDKLITTQNKNRQTPMTFALRSGNAMIVKQLMERGALLDLSDKSLLDILIQFNAGEIFELLFEYPEFRKGISQLNAKGLMPILSAVLATEKKQSAAITRGIVEKSVFGWSMLVPLIVYRSLQGDSILFHLIEFNQKEKLEYLLQIASIRALMFFKNSKGQSPLFYAAIQCSNRAEIVKLLIEIGGADIQELISWRHVETGSNILFHEKEGDGALIDYLLELDAIKILINTQNKLGETPLTSAISAGRAKTVKRFVEKGASLDPVSLFQNPKQKSILHKLKFSTDINIEKLGFILGLSPNSKQKREYCNALMIFGLENVSIWPSQSRFSLNNLMTILMQHGACLKECLDVRYENGDTILSKLIREKRYFSVKYLADAGIATALLKIANNAGETPISLALKSKNTTFVTLLLDSIPSEDMEYYNIVIEEIAKFRNVTLDTILAASLRERNLANFRYFLSHKALKSLLIRRDQHLEAAIHGLISEFFANALEIIDYCGDYLKEIADSRDQEGNFILSRYFNSNPDEYRETNRLYQLLQWPAIRTQIDLPNKAGMTLLIAAAMYGKLNVYKLLRFYGASNSAFKHFRYNDQTILGFFVQDAPSDKVHCLQRLLELPEIQGLIEDKNEDDATPLVLSALSNDVDFLKLLLEQGANVESLINYRDVFANTILHLLAENGLIKTLRYVSEIPQIKALLEMKNVIGQTPLLMAALQGKRKCFNILLNAGASTKVLQEYRTTNGDSLLAFAAGFPDAESGENTYKATNLSEKFLALSFVAAEISSSGKDGLIPLLKTVLAGHTANFKCLLKAGASIVSIENYSDCHKNNIFHLLTNYEIEEHHEPFIKYLFENYPELKEMLHAKNDNDETPFVAALNRNNAACLFAFYKTGAYTLEQLTGIKYINGNNILLKAVDLGNEAIVQFFLEIEGLRDALIVETNQQGYSAAILCALKGESSIIELLSLEGEVRIPIYWQAGLPILSEAAKNGYIEGVEYLLQIPKIKETIKVKDRFGRSALFQAAARGYSEIVDLLIENGAESLLELQALSDGTTVLHEAAKIGSVQGAEYLLNSPLFIALLDQADNYRVTPIMHASYTEHDNLEVFKVLLKWGANISLKDQDGFSALDSIGKSLEPIVAKIKAIMALATQKSADFLDTQLNQILINQILTSALELGVSFNMRFESRKTLLHFAAIHGNAPLIRELVSLGADLQAEDVNSKRAVDLAMQVTQLSIKVLSLCNLLLLHAEADYKKLFDGAKEAMPITIPETILNQIRRCIDLSIQIEDEEELGYLCMRLAKWIWNEAPLREIFKIEKVLELYRRIPKDTHYYQEAQFDIATLLICDDSQTSMTSFHLLQDNVVAVDARDLEHDQKAKINREIAYLYAFEGGKSKDASVLRKQLHGALEDKGLSENPIDLLDPVQLFQFLQDYKKELTPVFTERKLWQEKYAATQTRLQQLKQKKLEMELGLQQSEEGSEKDKDKDKNKDKESEVGTLTGSRKRKVLASDESTILASNPEDGEGEPLHQKLRISAETQNQHRNNASTSRRKTQSDGCRRD